MDLKISCNLSNLIKNRRTKFHDHDLWLLIKLHKMSEDIFIQDNIYIESFFIYILYGYCLISIYKRNEYPYSSHEIFP